MMRKQRSHTFLLVASFPDSIVTFRAALIGALQSHGCQVHAASPDLPPQSRLRMQLEAMNVTVHEIPLHRTGTNPLADLITLVHLLRLMLSLRPEIVLGYTVKPVIYGSLAAWLTRVPRRFALITGLGYTLRSPPKTRRPGFLRDIVRQLYTLALRTTHKVFFQNPDDQAVFRNTGIMGRHTPSFVINGSGVDIQHFSPVPIPATPHFLLIARLLGDKGVREYAQAAQTIRRRHPEAIFSLVGWIDDNPDAISQAELNQWSAESLNYLGRLNDVRPAIENCSVYVLPSYHEGTPRTVLEAMAMGRAIITSDAPGCRETVQDGYNGYLVPVRSVDGLVAAMQRFIDTPELTQEMGSRSRTIAVDKYDVRKVNAALLSQMGL